MDRAELRAAATCLEGVRKHFHEHHGHPFFAVKVFRSPTDVAVIPRQQTFEELGECDSLFVLVATLDKEDPRQLFAIADARDENVAALEEVLEEVDADVRDSHGETAACKVCRQGHLGMLRSLHLANADFTLGPRGATPLLLSCQEGHLACARFLLGTGRLVLNLLEVRDRESDTPLTKAARFGHTPCVELLVASRADIEAKGRYGNTAIIVAAKHGHADCVRFLLDQGAVKDAQANDLNTSLILAADRGHPKSVEILLSAGADKDIEANNGRTALDCASGMAARRSDVEGYAECARLLEAAKGGNSRQLLQGAELGRPSVVRAALAAGVSLEVKNRYGKTALMLAAEKGHVECLQLLLARGANKDAQSNDDDSALSLASTHGHAECLALLRAHGA